ncbi:betaine-aldehyde dehydrogenase [Francisella adeliensis]|uniref:Betaine-aldehyde dehydrogenase n=1 Tax=Francisella adeliensis TaxID=2007306 RepID=A0A2Z4XXX3_9GAMM|nr:betaine-aldehyde dehydrogenase [Francisella adeliensis]AXA33283.1 betaine-aldehyde dehydrogenase [Francisella adeliensis]MBK2084989.1 betaine-aldehyde dehydrogenase [Francisella adeliensis]MBK2097019.1 betaine-aldehyde dehydrogenase [Francisella adeliensis]QIW11511.1 betaine-aldehyde dehydrogenase [Francisella adeliensis]QIW13386.1 betaine-aldehyde dehydrogenase [Francisella adeliensis]
MKTYKSFINGEFIDNKSGNTFDVVNPATGEVIYKMQEADDFVIDLAIKSSQEAFKKWSSLPQIERTRLLQKVVNHLRKKNDELAKVEVLDTGKPLQEAIEVDIQTGADAIEYFANLAHSTTGIQQQVGDDFFYTRREPLGIALGIGAWNYPLQIACWKAAPALASGNVMIFKPSEETPLGAIKLAEVFIEAGVPAGVFNVVQGAAEVGKALVNAPEVEKVSFTGEVSTGKKVMSAAAASLKEVTMELGGKSPLIVFEDANIDEAVTAAMLGNFYTQGEICTNCTRVFVHETAYEQFIEKLVKRTKENIIAGDTLDINTNFGALISEKHMELVLRYIEIGKKEGAKLLTGGQRISSLNGYFIEPTIFADCTDDMTIVKEEIFGPVMSILKFSSEDEVISRANDTKLGLAAGVFTNDIRKAHRVIHQIEAGICWINAYGASPSEMPVGGYKLSGVGRENGIEALNHYTQTKSIYVGMAKLEGPF